MRIQDIKVGEYYRLKNTSGEFCKYYGWVKVLEIYNGWVKVLQIYKRGQYNSPDIAKALVKCEHTVNKDDTMGFIRYFSPADLVDTKGE